MKILTIVGARPQFIKSAPVSKALRDAGHEEFLLHTGQHYDHRMSQIFFEEMGISKPNANLGVGSGLHGQQTGQMLIQIEEILLTEKPDWVLVYGDTNSTIAGALAAIKLHIPVAHVEAGLRSFNREMPEEHNRVLTDHCADLLFCPTQTAVDNLAHEGVSQGVHLVGDTMYDAVLQFSKIAQQQSTILQNLELMPQEYLLATVHRPYNTDVPENLANIISAFLELGEPVVFPVHPRTRKVIEALDIDIPADKNLRLIEPVGYLDMLMLEQNARMMMTDSGGMQKEAYFFAIPCITLRPETEWVETVETGWNRLVGADKQQIIKDVQDFMKPQTHLPLYGNGTASELIADKLA
ncbi:UDP-N-acetylglucosamine 2-epimerase (non-hydrolyzing) [Anaerolineales bacterium HSG24]|nr:UDP-N-acetylglucosamine 2-epimerase (non-hydrolyzing) [Anaerolineales bacterium HSG24]